MTVTAFRIQNFMGFEDSGWIELRPITLLFGRNSSGKSALIRALLLLRQSLESEPGGGALLFVKDDGFDFGDFREVVRNHNVRHELAFWFRCRFDHDTKNSNSRRAFDAINDSLMTGQDNERLESTAVTVRLILRKHGFSGELRLSALDILDEEGDLVFRANARSNSNPNQTSWEFVSEFFDLLDVQAAANLWPYTELFTKRGFLPWIRPMQSELVQAEENEPDEDVLGKPFHIIWLILRGMRNSIEDFLQNINYLGPLRSAPQRYYYVAGQSSSSPERGKQFVRNLVKADSNSLNAISGWLDVSGTPYRLDLRPLDKRKALYEIRLQDTSQRQQRSVSANIREVGFGVTQVLPIITQAVLAQMGDTLIIEQPELHLHPRAQAELGNMFIAIAQKGVNCFIETHSEHLLLRLQKHIAKTTVGEIDPQLPGQMLLPNQVAVYFVHRKELSTVSQIEIGPYGDLLNTPDGFEDFFSDDMLETAERMRARLGHRSKLS